MVAKYLPEAQTSQKREPTQISIGNQGQRLVDGAVLAAFAERLFRSVRQKASKTLNLGTVV
jgi:hypothetical protein